MVVVLAWGGNTVMTCTTVRGYALVVEVGIGERSGNMTHRTILAADWNVRGIDLGAGAGSNGSVMAGSAVIDDAGMIEYRRCKAAAGRVADTTILGCHHVGRIHLGVFTGGGNAVAGIATGRQYGRIAMVDKRVDKCSRIVANSTILVGYRMRRRGRLRPGPKSCKTAVVAGDAIIDDASVSEHRGRRRKRVDIVANVTILARW